MVDVLVIEPVSVTRNPLYYSLTLLHLTFKNNAIYLTFIQHSRTVNITVLIATHYSERISLSRNEHVFELTEEYETIVKFFIKHSSSFLAKFSF
jgi:hypothetical protein